MISTKSVSYEEGNNEDKVYRVYPKSVGQFLQEVLSINPSLISFTCARNFRGKFIINTFFFRKFRKHAITEWKSARVV
jgi:hypothetical protein